MVKISKNTLKLLNVFYSHPEQQFYIQELGRILKKKPGVFQRVLYKLEKDHVLKSEYKANARFFWANKQYPIYKELKSIVYKSGGLAVWLLIFMCFCLPEHYGYCQEQGGVVLSSLNDAISLAFNNNKDIKIQEQEVNVAKADVMGARSVFYPDLNLNAGYTRNGAVLLSSAANSKKDAGVFTGYKNDNQLGLSLTQALFTGGANTANLRQMQISFKEQEETLRATKLNVEFEAKRLYYGLLLAYETRRIAADLVQKAQAHYENVKQRYEQGTASRFDVLQSKVQVSLLIPELVNAENAIDQIMAEFNKLLSLKIQESVTVNDRLIHMPVEVREEEFLKQAYLNKPEMIIKSLGIDMNQWAIKFAKAGWYPQVTASGGYNYYSNNNANMINKRHNNWSVGAAMTLNIFNGFATKAKVDSAKAKYAESLLSKENTADLIAVNIRTDCLDLIKQQAIIDSQKDNLEDAKEALKISEVRFDNGVGINLDVLDAQVSLAQVEQNLAQGIYDYIMAKADLDRNMGVEYFKPVETGKRGNNEKKT
ncbi:MAG: TolC family protein [Candidatus Omnitrophota bacterium]